MLKKGHEGWTCKTFLINVLKTVFKNALNTQ